MRNDDIKKSSYRELMDEFEAVCAEFDSNNIDIERAIELHGRATELLDELEERLQKAEAAIKKHES